MYGVGGQYGTHVGLGVLISLYVVEKENQQ